VSVLGRLPCFVAYLSGNPPRGIPGISTSPRHPSPLGGQLVVLEWILVKLGKLVENG